MGNLELMKKANLSSFRRIAIGTWRHAYDPSVYGRLTLRMDEALRYMEAFRRSSGKRLTVSHMMAKAVAAVMESCPDANAILRWNRIYLRKRIGTFFQVALEDAATGEVDLSGAMIEDPEQKSLAQIIDEFTAKTETVRSGKDKQLEGTRSMFKRIPFGLLNGVLKLISFLSYTLNLDLRWMGVPRDPFGSVMITNIGSLGLEQAYVPLVPYSRVPLVVALGSVVDAPVVENGRLVVGKVMHVCVTFDHRVLDGTHAAEMAKIVREWMEQPFEHFDALRPAGTAPIATVPAS
jgi:pyruvate/2-oxoglutarate dehydrogenase complex dihydrolipoamide acyltransferase (E2) component